MPCDLNAKHSQIDMYSERRRREKKCSSAFTSVIIAVVWLRRRRYRCCWYRRWSLERIQSWWFWHWIEGNEITEQNMLSNGKFIQDLAKSHRRRHVRMNVDTHFALIHFRHSLIDFRPMCNVRYIIECTRVFEERACFHFVDVLDRTQIQIIIGQIAIEAFIDGLFRFEGTLIR